MFNEIVVMSATPTPKAARHVAERVSKGQCLCCDEPAIKRGLGQSCYYAWMANRRKLNTPTKRAAYDAKLIRIGRLLAPQAVRSIRDRSVFGRTSSEVG
jgi:hypothetical protein